MARSRIILKDHKNKKVHSFHRFAQFKEDPMVPVDALLEQFTVLLKKSRRVEHLSKEGVIRYLEK